MRLNLKILSHTLLYFNNILQHSNIRVLILLTCLDIFVGKLGFLGIW